MKNLKVLILPVVLAMMLACEDKPLLGETVYDIKFQNQSRHAIYFYEAAIYSPSQYPDTIPPHSKMNFVKVDGHKEFYIDSKQRWEDNFKQLKKDTLSVYIIDATIFENKNWEQIRADYHILQRYDLSIQDLQKLDFNLPYPATPAMRHVKMWPKYQP